MANEQNLIPQAHKLSVEEASKGGKASGESRRRRKAFSEAFDMLLQKEFADQDGNVLTGVEAIAAKTFQAAMNGDLKAMQIIRDTVGEMPVQRVETVEISEETYRRVEEALKD